MKTILPKFFMKQLERLRRGGGTSDVVHRQVVAAIDHWQHGLATTLNLTHYGESRIQHARKYDLRASYRLVTTEHEGRRTLLWVGTHDDVDAWLDRHKGWDFTLTPDGEIVFIPTSEAPRDVTHITSDESPTARLAGRVLSGLPDSVVELLSLSKKMSRALQRITHEDLVDDDSTWDDISDQEYDSPGQRSAVLDVFHMLSKGLVREATGRAQLFAKQAVTDTSCPDDLTAAIELKTASADLCDLSTLSEAELRRLLTSTHYADWLLYLHPHQQRHVDAEHAGAARLIGVSGSGKTCVLVHRANALAKRYGGERILILVLNESLQHLIKNLIKTLCLPEQQKQIQVYRFYEFCYQAIKTISPDALIENYDPASREDLPDCWRDFTEKEHALRLVEPLVLPLEAQGVDPWGYLHDELIWVRTGFGMAHREREEYLTCDRAGRGLPFPKAKPGGKTTDRRRASKTFPNDTRLRVLAILEQYEEYMSDGGLLDEDGVALRAFEIRDRISQSEKLRARCVLIDEVQDCSTNQLAIAAGLLSSAKDGLFLVGDPVQKVFPRQQSLPAAGIDIRGRATHLTTNYRNTKQVLEAAYQIIHSFRGNSPVPAEEILNPEYALRTGPRPKLVQCESVADQYRCIGAMIELLRCDAANTMCVASARPDIAPPPKAQFGAPKPRTFSVDRNLLALCKSHGWPVKSLANRVKLEDLASNVIAARFEEMKGFEFRAVFLTDLTDTSLLTKSIPKDEEWRIAFQLYVAMTRAQEELWLFCAGPPCRLLAPLLDFVDRITPSDI